MAAYFTVWEPRLGLDPQKDEDGDRFKEIIDAREPPTPTMLALLDFMLERFPQGREEPVWSMEPVREFVTGPVMCFCVVWSKYEEMRLFARPAARNFGLDYYDHQRDEYVPAGAPRDLN